MKVYSMNNIELVHITEAQQALGYSIRYMRHLVEEGNQIRLMKSFRDRSRLMIPVIEIKGFPFLAPHHAQGPSEVYHYVPTEEGPWERKLCETCSFTDKFCEARQQAEDLVLPEGDI